MMVFMMTLATAMKICATVVEWTTWSRGRWERSAWGWRRPCPRICLERTWCSRRWVSPPCSPSCCWERAEWLTQRSPVYWASQQASVSQAGEYRQTPECSSDRYFVDGFLWQQLVFFLDRRKFKRQSRNLPHVSLFLLPYYTISMKKLSFSLNLIEINKQTCIQQREKSVY